MKNIIALSFLMCAAIVVAAQTSDISTLKQLNEDWIHSYPNADTATLSRILADDLVMINGKGVKLGKKDILANMRTMKQQLVSSRVDSVEVRILGDVGLVTAKASFVSKSNGREVTGRNSYLDVYEKRNGKWVAVAAHVTSLK